MRLVFLGTPEFSIPSLRELIHKGHEIAAVITQPDRPKGRGQKVTSSPVAMMSQELGLRVLKPIDVNSAESIDTLSALSPDLIVVVAYGLILGTTLLGLPRLGCINLHASYLPKYRGVAPANRAIMNGETWTGTTTIFMDEGIDTGDIILQRKTEISPEETAGELLQRLAKEGASLLAETVLLVGDGKAPRVKQDSSLASYARKLKKSDGEIKWDKDAIQVFNLIRGVTPWPGAFTFLRESLLKILKAQMVDFPSTGRVPGEILQIGQEGILVRAGTGALSLLTLQPEGKRPMRFDEFARGRKLQPGEVFKS
ncbi:MAG: methionyl-tRNA formyltransferase [Candidatus Eisenbacteria bacterium]|nr:methionyl-tRNA formyltransferase [Candidatus Eisenbacteria bacterium]